MLRNVIHSLDNNSLQNNGNRNVHLGQRTSHNNNDNNVMGFGDGDEAQQACTGKCDFHNWKTQFWLTRTETFL